MNKSRGRPFQTGNTFGRGRPKGSPNKSTLAAQRLLEQHYEPLMAKQLKAAHDGDAKARQWCLSQIRPVASAPKLKLPPPKTIEDIGKAHIVIINAVASRTCTAAEGLALTAMLEEQRKLIELYDVAPRIEELERLVKSLQRT